MKNLNTHMKNTGILASNFGKFLNLKKETISNLYIAGIKHDVGKLLIDEEILNKPSKLTDEEFFEVRKHPDYSRKILLREGVNEDIVLAVSQHHERDDGKGYPSGLKGKQISLMGKILALCDSYDAMRSKRVYNKTLSEQLALDEIRNNLGTQFDSELGIEFISFINFERNLILSNYQSIKDVH